MEDRVAPCDATALEATLPDVPLALLQDFSVALGG